LKTADVCEAFVCLFMLENVISLESWNFFYITYYWEMIFNIKDLQIYCCILSSGSFALYL